MSFFVSAQIGIVFCILACSVLAPPTLASEDTQTMDHSVSSLSYQGSIVEAISEAKRQKKLLVVYISGNNEESGNLERSTWINPTVADSILKYCILLHVLEGTTDAANFSAICFLASVSLDPQKSSPWITAVGYNGVQLWQNEGFIDAETLATSLQKAWLSLHIQDTLLTAALVSKTPEQQEANSSTSTTFQQGSSSGMNTAPLSVAKNAESLENNEPDSVEMENSAKTNHLDKVHEETDINVGKIASPSVSANIVDGCKDGLATSLSKSSNASLTPDNLDGYDTKLREAAIEDKCDSGVVDNNSNSGFKEETLQVILDKESERSQDKKADDVQGNKVKETETLSKSTEVHLNIRLLDGTTLQNKFLLTSTLRMVKDYVDANQTSVRGSYDLAIPYPRKVFTDQDLNQTLSELGLVGRQALIVVQANRGSLSGGQRSSTSYADSRNSNSEGYFSYLSWVLSYVNPLSYLHGGASSSNSAQETPGNVWQNGRNPGLRNISRGIDVASSSNNSTPGSDINNSSKKATSHFGSNIHTLKHDEDHSQTGDRNKFWNGNSTQYGGDGDPK